MLVVPGPRLSIHSRKPLQQTSFPAEEPVPLEKQVPEPTASLLGLMYEPTQKNVKRGISNPLHARPIDICESPE